MISREFDIYLTHTLRNMYVLCVFYLNCQCVLAIRLTISLVDMIKKTPTFQNCPYGFRMGVG